MDQHTVDGHINAGFKMNDLQENGQEAKQEVHFFYLYLTFIVIDKCLMIFSTIQKYLFPLYRGCQFYWWRKPEFLSQVTD
jgi:hypothetical protein